jgi:2-methylcitrate dehydratase PrpD
MMAHIGVMAALLAQKGYLGDRAVLDGDIGFWKMLGALGANWDFLVNDLGKKWWILEDAIKLYPCCRALHPGLDMFYKINGEQKFQPEEIENVTVRLHPAFMGFYGLREPYLKLDPADIATEVNLQFSVPYAITMAALGITPGPDWYSSETLSDSRVGQFMKKVQVKENPKAGKELLKLMREDPTGRLRKQPCSITIVARGKTFDDSAEYVSGDPWFDETRLSDDQVAEKFRNYCHNIIPDEKIERVVELVYTLEKLDNVAKLAQLLAQ